MTYRLGDEAARTYIRRFGAISDGELIGLLHELAEAAAATVEGQGVPRSEQATTYHVDLRYHGQGFEITVPAADAAFDGNGAGLAALARTTRIWVDGSHADTAVYDRTALRAGNVVTGPAIITEMDSTTLVLPGHAATVHPGGSLLIRPTEG
jgi:N-methylhydantoinase A